jgi:cystathionine beta-lyase/cystathionine gamma-synthase
MKLTERARFATICLHAGQTPDPSTGAIITPIFQTATYAQEEVGKHKGFEYARTQNPTRAAVEANLAAIEGGCAAFAFASGMSAINAIAARLASGDHVIVTDNTYGGTFRLFDKVLRRMADVQLRRHVGSRRHRARVHAPDQARVRRNADQPGHADHRPLRRREDAHSRGVAGRGQHVREPVLAAPLSFGATWCPQHDQHSNGHSDSVGGVVVANRDEDIEWLRFIQNAAGAILSPFDSWLVLRGTKTLPLRMAQHSANGMALATFLASPPA